MTRMEKCIHEVDDCLLHTWALGILPWKAGRIRMASERGSK